MASVHHFEWLLRASPPRLWPYVADTERLNAALGLPPWDFVDEKTPDGTKRTGSMRYMGMGIAWDEKPFEWVEGKELAVERVFKNGPVARYSSRVRLEPSGEGTQLRQSLEFEPRSAPMAIVAHFEFGVRVRRNLDRVYRGIDAYLSGEAPSAYRAKRRTLPARGAERLKDIARRLVGADGFEKELVDRLVELILSADERTLCRLRPLELADAWDQERGHVLRLFVRGAARGLFSLAWDVICPTCRGAKVRVEELARLGSEAHCGSCDVRIDTRAERALELIFALSPTIASVQSTTHCIGSPRNTPHVVYQRRLAPRARETVALVLTPGSYRLRGPGVGKPGYLTVSASGERAAAFKAAGEDVRPSELASASGFELSLENDGAEERLLLLERVAWHDDAVTVGRALACEELVAAFPRQLPPPSLALVAGRLAVLAVHVDLERATAGLEPDEAALAKRDVGGRIEDAARRHQGAVVRGEGQRLLAFVDLDAAFAAARSLRYDLFRHAAERGLALSPSLALAAGPCSVVSSAAEHARIEGEAVSEARALLGVARAGDIVLDDALASELRILDGERLAAGPGGRALVRLAAGAPDEAAALSALRFDELELGATLGRGATSTVQAAIRKRDGRRFAVKILASSEAKARARFEREVRALARLRGVPGVVSAQGWGEHEGRPWIALDLVDGTALDLTLAAAERFPAPRAAALLAPVARALDEAHRRGVLHRDVKPGNIVLDREGKPWLVDFGIARLQQEPKAPWVLAGTLAYLPPEALDPDHPEFDGRSDVYSLGATFFELVAGRRLFGEASGSELVVKVVSESSPDLLSVVPGAPPAAAWVVRHALRKRPQDRYATAGELAADLEALARSELPVHAPDEEAGAGTTRRFAASLMKQAIDAFRRSDPEG